MKVRCIIKVCVRIKFDKNYFTLIQRNTEACCKKRERKKKTETNLVHKKDLALKKTSPCSVWTFPKISYNLYQIMKDLVRNLVNRE